MNAINPEPIVKTTNKLSPRQIREIGLYIRQLIITRQLFLKKGYTLTELSKESGYTLHVLSAVINAAEKKHFNDYLNQFRITYCIKHFEETKSLRRTLEDLSSLCGFNNRNTFTVAFKKITGKMPSQYFKLRNNKS